MKDWRAALWAADQRPVRDGVALSSNIEFEQPADVMGNAARMAAGKAVRERIGEASLGNTLEQNSDADIRVASYCASSGHTTATPSCANEGYVVGLIFVQFSCAFARRPGRTRNSMSATAFFCKYSVSPMTIQFDGDASATLPRLIANAQ